MSIQIQYFYRKPDPQRHSIEKLFAVIRSHISKKYIQTEAFVPFYSNSIRNLLGNMLFAYKMRKQINHITGDIHYVALFLPGKRTLLTIHDIEVLNRTKGIRHMFIKRLWFVIPAWRVQLVSVISEFSASELRKHLPGIDKKIRVVHNCISERFQYSPKLFNSEKPVILHLGTKANKNLPRLIEACKGLNVTLRIAGKLDESVRGTLIESQIVFENKDFLHLEEIIEWYKECDILSFVSLYEGFGLPILEAQATGRVVISSNAASMPEVAGDGALLIDPLNTNEIRNAIIEICNKPDLRESLINKGLENVKRFQVQEVAAAYERLYAEMLN